MEGQQRAAAISRIRINFRRPEGGFTTPDADADADADAAMWLVEVVPMQAGQQNFLPMALTRINFPRHRVQVRDLQQ